MNVDRRVLVSVAVLAAAVRLPGVYNQAFWEDEVASARIISEPTFPRLLAHVARTESTPPLWYALGWLAHQAGAPIQDVRLLSVVAGALLAALVVDLAREFVPTPLAVAAGLLTAVGGQLVAHGHELRAYELLALISAIFARCVIAEAHAPSRGREVALGAVVAAGGLTHYYFAFSALAALAWLWLDPTTRAVRRRASIAILIGGVAAASWAPVMLAQLHQHRFWWIGPFRLRAVLAVPARLFTSAYANTNLGMALSVGGLLLVAAGCLRLSRTSAAGRLLAVLAVAPVGEAGLVWAGGIRVFALRNLIGVAPFVAVAAVAALPRRRVTLAAAVAGAGLLALSSASIAGRVPPYDAIARALVAKGWTPSTPVAVFGDFFRYRAPLEWYLPHRPVLEVSRRRDGVCRTVFVIHGDDVARLRLTGPIHAEPRLHGATILSDPARTLRCVRAITTGRLAALA